MSEIGGTLPTLPPPAPQSTWAWFLDVDGTLAPIASAPNLAVVDQVMLRSVELLYELSEGALALISGRSVHDLDILFPHVTLPVAGQHGAERRSPNGEITRYEGRKENLQAMRHELTLFERAHDGLLLEDKGLSLALHYRRAPHLESVVREIVGDIWQRWGAGFHLQLGKCVVEVIPVGNDKGLALRQFMLDEPFRGRLPVFLGDDVSDEPAFAVVNELGGYSIKVGLGASCASYRLDGVTAVQEWLAALTGLNMGDTNR